MVTYGFLSFYVILMISCIYPKSFEKVSWIFINHPRHPYLPLKVSRAGSRWVGEGIKGGYLLSGAAAAALALGETCCMYLRGCPVSTYVSRGVGPEIWQNSERTKAIWRGAENDWTCFEKVVQKVLWVV